jgi:predicted enzyme related to lactoylglutathione lyase
MGLTAARSAFGPPGLATSDPAGARAFYTVLLRWQAEGREGGPSGSYTVFRDARGEAALLYRQTEEARRAQAMPHWTSYVTVEDADAVARRARELGAAVLREPADVAAAGRMATLREPSGAIVTLWQPREPANGGSCWNELATPDVDAAAAFLSGLLGWGYEIESSGYRTIMGAGGPAGGIRERDEAPADWLPYFPVDNAEITARMSETLGGRRLAPAEHSPFGRAVLIADPQGAVFGLFEGGRG